MEELLSFFRKITKLLISLLRSRFFFFSFYMAELSVSFWWVSGVWWVKGRKEGTCCRWCHRDLPATINGERFICAITIEKVQIGILVGERRPHREHRTTDLRHLLRRIVWLDLRQLLRLLLLMHSVGHYWGLDCSLSSTTRVWQSSKRASMQSESFSRCLWTHYIHTYIHLNPFFVSKIVIRVTRFRPCVQKQKCLTWSSKMQNPQKLRMHMSCKLTTNKAQTAGKVCSQQNTKLIWKEIQRWWWWWWCPAAIKFMEIFICNNISAIQPEQYFWEIMMMIRQEVLQRFQMHPPHRCISRQERKILKKDEQIKQQQNHHMHVFSDLQ